MLLFMKFVINKKTLLVSTCGAITKAIQSGE